MCAYTFDFVAKKCKAKVRKNRCLGRSGKNWKLLAEVQNKKELLELCHANGVNCLFVPYESRPCPLKRLFLKSKGKHGFDCPYRLYFRPNSKRSLKNKCANGKLNGTLFCRGEHCHAFQVDESSASESGLHLHYYKFSLFFYANLRSKKE